jgi:Arc/MetJ-type ribon-helix-helix transcriptional regulator
MGSERITITLPPDLVANARTAVRSGAAASLSAFVADALRSQLERNQALDELERVLGGRPPQEALDAVRRDWGLSPAGSQQVA